MCCVQFAYTAALVHGRALYHPWFERKIYLSIVLVLIKRQTFFCSFSKFKFQISIAWFSTLFRGVEFSCLHLFIFIPRAQGHFIPRQKGTSLARRKITFLVWGVQFDVLCDILRWILQALLLEHTLLCLECTNLKCQPTVLLCTYCVCN